MAVIEFSAGLMSGLPQRVIFPTTTSSAVISTPINAATNQSYCLPLLPYLFYYSSTAYPYQSGIIVYQGAVPTDFASLTLWTSRSSDALITYNNTSASTFSSTINVTSNPAVINSTFNTAAASGTATWFRWMVAISSSVGSLESPNVIMHQIIGTVGATGSGADLELPSTSIVSGQSYRIQNLRIQFPSSWTYT